MIKFDLIIVPLNLWYISNLMNKRYRYIVFSSDSCCFFYHLWNNLVSPFWCVNLYLPSLNYIVKIDHYLLSQLDWGAIIIDTISYNNLFCCNFYFFVLIDFKQLSHGDMKIFQQEYFNCYIIFFSVTVFVAFIVQRLKLPDLHFRTFQITFN